MNFDKKEGKDLIVLEIEIEKIIPDLNQRRRNFDEKQLKELAKSITLHGLLQPIAVKTIGDDRFQIIHGERRYRACKLVGMKTIPAFVRVIDNETTIEVQLIENLQRTDLNPIEEAQTFRRMVKELGYTHEEIAEKIGKSREYVTNKIRLLKLTNTVKEALENRKISEGHARVLITQEEKVQEEFLKFIETKNLSVNETEEFARSLTNVSHETSEIPTNAQIIGIWIEPEILSILSKMAETSRISIEKLCSQIISGSVTK